MDLRDALVDNWIAVVGAAVIVLGVGILLAVFVGGGGRELAADHPGERTLERPEFCIDDETNVLEMRYVAETPLRRGRLAVRVAEDAAGFGDEYYAIRDGNVKREVQFPRPATNGDQIEVQYEDGDLVQVVWTNATHVAPGIHWDTDDLEGRLTGDCDSFGH